MVDLASVRGCQPQAAGKSRAGPTTRVADHLALLKPRVMSLAVFTGWVGLAIAPGQVSLGAAAATLMCMAAGAGACGALNMWYEADIDALMRRTALRPIPRGRVASGAALTIGFGLAVFSVTALGLLVNWIAAALLGFTIALYVLVYTMGLKRRTPLNIVIGGAAGAFPPVIGWAAATGSVDVGALILFLIIFLWTPPHFWSLSLVRIVDYARAGVPMLPVVAGTEETCRQILLYSLLLVAASLAPLSLGLAGPLYAVSAVVLGLLFVSRALALRRQKRRERLIAAAQRLFGFSILYMLGLFAALLASAI